MRRAALESGKTGGARARAVRIFPGEAAFNAVKSKQIAKSGSFKEKGLLRDTSEQARCTQGTSET